MTNSYHILLDKLDRFIRRYYLYEMLKGFFLGGAIILFVWLLESVLEYYNYLPVSFRTFLFYFTLVLFVLLFGHYLLRPLLALNRIGKHLDRREASKIISRHFTDVKDKLLNTLELGEKLADESDNSLLLAGIEQRTALLNPLPFKFALPVQSVKKSFYYFLFASVILISGFVISPDIVLDGTKRILNYDVAYEIPAPFQFIFQNYQDKVKKGASLEVLLKIDGAYLPDQVYILLSNNSFLMKAVPKSKNLYSYKIKNLNNDINVRFSALGYYSKNYSIEVLPAPVLKNFLVEVIPPAYTGIEKFVQKNTGDLNVPYGSKIKWKFQSAYTDSVFLVFDSLQFSCKKIDEQFIYERSILKAIDYSLIFKNRNFQEKKDIQYSISLIPDLFPEIDFQFIEDSLHASSFYYMLNVRDDYGFRKLSFNYRIISGSDTSGIKSISIPFVKNLKNQDVFYYFDFTRLQLPTDESSVQYYFEITDNDYISGFKKTRTSLQFYKPQSFEEQRQKIEEYRKSTENYIEESKKLVDDINKQISEFKRKELTGELTEWEKKNYVKSLAKKQNQLHQLLDKIEKENQKKNNLDDRLHKKNQEILEKQKEIQKILDELLDDELKQLLKELEELQNKFDDKKFEQLQQKLELSYEDLDKNLDKTLELLKRYQVEEKINNLSEDLDKLAKRQEQIKDKNYSKNEKENKQIEQKSIQNSFKSLQKEFDKVQRQNAELKRPYQMQNLDKDFEHIQNQLDKIEQDINKKSKKKIKEQQEQVSEDMKNLSKKMEDMLNEMNSMSLKMNMEDLRQLIDNLSQFSIAQEEVYVRLNKIYANDPLYNTLMEEQNKLSNDFDMLRDSLQSLSTRVVQMNKIINKELKNINYSMKKALAEFEQLHRRSVMRQQRSILNSANILALYLDEVKDQMQKQMAQSGSGKGKQKMPKNSMQQLKQQQQNLKQQLEQLLEELKKNGGKPGPRVDEQIVKSLAEQEKFNKMLKELQNQEGISPEGMKQLKEIKKLSDENINDLINKNISPELLRRNENIKTRLLQSEKAERKREQDKIRESKEGMNIKREFPKEIEEFLKKKMIYKETLQKNNLNLNLFYKNLSKEYYQRIK